MQDDTRAGIQRLLDRSDALCQESARLRDCVQRLTAYRDGLLDQSRTLHDDAGRSAKRVTVGRPPGGECRDLEPVRDDTHQT
jgi:hypothetical protein